MPIIHNMKTRLYHLSLRKRLTISNILMFMIPVISAALTAFAALSVAFHVFKQFYLPRMEPLHEMGEQYEKELRSFLFIVAILCVILLLLLVFSIVFTNRFLTRFMFRRVEEPLELLTDGVAHISKGELDYTIFYNRTDEFAPVCTAFNDMAARLKHSAEQSASEEQCRRELFAGISHDLRSPLTSVRAYTEALLDGIAKTPEDTRRYLTKIRLHEAEIEHLVEALFLYTKMELKDYPVHLQTLNIRRELLRIMEDNPLDAHITTDLSGIAPLSVVADPFLLERITLNLLDNSRKYRKGDVAHVKIRAASASDGMLLSFADDDIGTSEEQLARLIDPFTAPIPHVGIRQAEAVWGLPSCGRLWNTWAEKCGQRAYPTAGCA